MKPFAILLSTCLAVLSTSFALAESPEWTQPQKPFRIYGNSYYVGTRGLSAILIASPQGLVLIDAPMERNAPQIEANIKALGFRVADIKLILNTHAHFDHAGAIATLARDSGARVEASEAGAKALMLGGKDPEDPQFGDASLFAPVAKVTLVPDGGVVRVGDVAITAHYTPGHTPGSTTWTWQSCDAGRCVNMVYADSLYPYGANGYHFTDDAAHPHRVEDYRRGIEAIAALPCDILITPHPDQSDFLDRVARRDAGTRPNPLIDANACRAYAESGRAMLQARLAKERAEAKGAGPSGH
ncbi:subclass B3 metallo-beta-lactamase [Dyella humicola]|uniref:subclass B3 metallo-beta-lactamase n=1 Tax=Dyella humicola TaxID=2992126 RepID=UPI002250D19A|nr:subclass B3 metallo-beta-lactamase [Dyella humicola]